MSATGGDVDFRIDRGYATHPDVEWLVIEPIWEELRTPYEPDVRLQALTPGQRAVYALTWTCSEVNNGGFDQYFWNSTGFLLPEAIEAAGTIGSPAWQRLLEDARDVLPAPYPRDRRRRQALLDELEERGIRLLSDLDDQLYTLDRSAEHNLAVLFKRYIERHPAEFFRSAAE